MIFMRKRKVVLLLYKILDQTYQESNPESTQGADSSVVSVFLSPYNKS